LLAQAIRDEPDTQARSLLALLLSGTVEFNNLLCSYKGEGTGAVRPTFSHHILKPERMPLENTVWGLPESSGCFSTLYKSRILSALKYRQKPFELRLVKADIGKPSVQKVYGLAARMSVPLAEDWNALAMGRGRALIRCGDARALPLPDASVDAIITDPPYFDFVHYSELADLFHGWLRLSLREHYPGFAASTTRQAGEIQQRSPMAFAQALTEVFTECRRVLKPNGVLVFSFHHSRDEGWAAVGRAILDAGLAVVAAHPVKAELSVATPKSAAGEAIDVDALLVCKRQGQSVPATLDQALADIAHNAELSIRSYQTGTQRQLTRGDIRVILQSQTLRVASLHNGVLRDQHGIVVGMDTLIGNAGRLVDQVFKQSREVVTAAD
jgi:putative DNA methylase